MLRRIQMLTFVLGLTVVAGADTLRVPSEYPTIQAAMAATVTGDTVLVAAVPTPARAIRTRGST